MIPSQVYIQISLPTKWTLYFYQTQNFGNVKNVRFPHSLKSTLTCRLPLLTISFMVTLTLGVTVSAPCMSLEAAETNQPTTFQHNQEMALLSTMWTSSENDNMWGGVCGICTSSSTGTLRGPIRLPLGVGIILTWTSRFPEARTPSKREASNASLQTI